MKTLIIVPAFNEAKMIGSVLTDLQGAGYKNIVVIDDGSRDDTAQIAQNLKVPTICHVVNRGLGAALATGFEYARLIRADAVVTFDSDGQHRATDLKALLAPIEKGSADVVIGSRFADLGKIPLDRKIVNLISDLITLLFYAVWTTDSQSGLRAFNKKAVDGVKIITDRMEVSSEFFKEIHRNHLKFKEIAIDAIYTPYSLKSSKQGNVAAASIKIGFQLLVRLFR